MTVPQNTYKVACAMDFIDKQILPPKSWEKFEDLTRALFATVWRSPLTQKNGRSGQKQHGVDVYGTPEATPDINFGVQCKGKNEGYRAKATIVEFDTELAKAEKFKPSLGHWTFATTAPNDARLQEHARLVSEQRVKEGKFPVAAIGWDTIQALLSSHQVVIEEFYPEHASDLPKIMAALRALPGSEELDQIRRGLIAFAPRSSVLNIEASVWSEVEFETARDLGPALMGRPLGPADVAACPILPEVAVLTADLERAGSARLAGVPGAGKSITILQVARQMYCRGWRVLRLADPIGKIPHFDESPRPTLYIVDDAHLTRPALLSELEERATASRWVLSAYTISGDKGGFPGAIQLDAKRAVRVIADGLLASPEATLAAVRRTDDWIGDRPGDEQLDLRIEHAAEQALYPWQFCFILGGGWRRASAMASSARAAGADLVLAAAAIRQLAARDAHCSREALLQLEHLGLVVRVPDRGTTVTKLTREQMMQMLDVRRLLEEYAFQLAAANVDDAVEAELREHLQRMKELVAKKDHFGVAEEDFKFHQTVWRASGNEALETTLTRLCVAVYAFLSMKRHSIGDAMQTAVKGHTKLMEALLTGKASEAKAAIRGHLEPEAALPSFIKD